MPITEKYAKEILSIPMYNGMARKEQGRVIEVINEYEESAN